MADTLILNRAFIAPIRFYQRFISPLLPKSCRYYPTCSEYAAQQFAKNSLIKAFILSTLRITKCNPFFRGGIDYPVVNFKKPNFLAKQRRIKVTWWFAPISANKATLIKPLV